TLIVYVIDPYPTHTDYAKMLQPIMSIYQLKNLFYDNKGLMLTRLIINCIWFMYTFSIFFYEHDYILRWNLCHVEFVPLWVKTCYHAEEESGIMVLNHGPEIVKTAIDSKTDGWFKVLVHMIYHDIDIIVGYVLLHYINYKLPLHKFHLFEIRLGQAH
ncbi:hypothetical protein ACJX0J_008518, partial [Zea mays]